MAKRNLLKKAASFIQEKMEINAGETVVYERPGLGCVEVSAIVGRTEYEQDSMDGYIGRVIRNDYSISRASLVINGIEIIQERNYIIRKTLDDGTDRWGVLGEDSVPHYQDSDGYGIVRVTQSGMNNDERR